MLGAHIKSVMMDINITLSRCQMCVCLFVWAIIYYRYSVIVSNLTWVIPRLSLSNHCGVSRYLLLFIWLVLNLVAVLGFPVQTWWKFGFWGEPTPPVRNKQNMITHMLHQRLYSRYLNLCCFRCFFHWGVGLCTCREGCHLITCYKDIGHLMPLWLISKGTRRWKYSNGTEPLARLLCDLELEP